MSRVDIVDVIGERIPLRKAGAELQALCPFHQEKTPSFTVSPAKQFYHCFGCGAHGTAIGFLMDYAHLGFREAVEELAARVGLEVPGTGGAVQTGPDYAPLYRVLEEASEHYRRQLAEPPRSARAVAYLEGRGLSGSIARDFRLGYAPPGWDGLLRALAQTPELQAAGMVVEKEGGRRYDRFRDRIMFPIRDGRGRTIAFGGRVLDDGTPKYLNSPETPIFHKRRELYGLFHARESQRTLSSLFVVEGYMDVVALAQAGIRNAVATLGTAVTDEHLRQIFRLVPEVVFCFDGDAAGRRAAWRAVEVSLALMREGHQARFMFLPEGEDPDSLVRERGAGAFEAAARGAVPLSELFFQHLTGQVDLTSLDGRARLAELARPYLGRLPHGPFRELMRARLSELSRLDAQGLASLMDEALPPARSRAPASHRPQGKAPSLVRRTITLLLHHPELAREVDDLAPLAEVDRPGMPLLIEMLRLLRDTPAMSMAGVLEHFRDSEAGAHLHRLAALEPAQAQADYAAELRGALTRLRAQRGEQRYRALLDKARTQGLNTEETRELTDLAAQVGRSPR